MASLPLNFQTQTALSYGLSLTSNAPEDATGKQRSIDDLIIDNLQRAFEDCFGDFQTVPTEQMDSAMETNIQKRPAKSLKNADPGENTEVDPQPSDLDSLWSNLIRDIDLDERGQIHDLVSSLIREERFLDALKIRRGEELDSWPTSSRLRWADLLSLIPARQKALFLQQFPTAPSEIAQVDLLAAARVQAEAYDKLRKMIRLLPQDVETRQIFWIEMTKHVTFELNRAYSVFESVLAYCARMQSKQGTFWHQVSICDRIQTYSQGLREMIRVLYRLQTSLANMIALPPYSPVFQILATALTSAADLQKWIRMKQEGSPAIVEVIKRNLLIDEWSMRATVGTGVDPICYVCYLPCQQRPGRVSMNYIIHDDITMHSSCANLFIHSTKREPSCLKIVSFVEQLLAMRT